MRFELVEGASKKFWEINLSGKSFVARWGRIGTRGQEKKQTFASAAVALREHDKLVATKRKKGYLEIGVKPGPAPLALEPRDAGLEAAIRADRDDPAVYEVYADWLQSRGNPLGELIMLQRRGQTRAANRLIGKLGLPPATIATFGWRSGLWQWLKLETEWHDPYEAKDKIDPVAAVRPLFASPLCCALEELRIGMLRWDENDKLVPAVLAEAGKQPWARDLPRLWLGAIPGDVDMAHHRVGNVGKLIAKQFPKLRWLKIHSGERGWGKSSAATFAIDGLVLPELEQLIIETCSFSKQRLRHLFAAKLPKLASLELWFGSENYNADCTIADLRPLFAGKVFPHVRELGLRNAEFTDEIAHELPGSTLAARLESLDLSMGTLVDAAARELAANAKRFKRLKTLSIDDNHLTPAAVREVRAAFAGVMVIAKEQKPLDDSIEGELYRYVSVSE
jgi:uncharacterized protein (TIGR02996 family)